MENTLQQAVAFFKSEPAYRTLLEQFKKKYESLGRIGGTVPVRLFTAEELEVIGSFFGVPGSHLAEKGTISLVAFEKQLAETRFGAVELKQLLDAFFGEMIKSNKQRQQEKDMALNRYVTRLRYDYSSLAFWFDHLLAGGSDVRWIWAMIDKQPDHFASVAAKLHTAYQHLPKSPERLPMFSQRITGDPHALDLHTDTGKLWLNILAVAARQALPQTTEDINELLQHYHIYRDDLLNFVTCSGLIAQTDTKIHPVWQAAVWEHTVQIVPIRELIHLTAVYPSYGQNVWVVENSGVSSALLDNEPSMPMVCTNGQFTLASFVLLDRLVESGIMLHYAGDFDPEGLGMAQRLLTRYTEDCVTLWHMDTEAYKASNPVKDISETRLEQLNRIDHPALIEVAAAMYKKGKVGYQEALVPRMVEDIRK